MPIFRQVPPDTDAGFGLLQRKCNLFFGITGLFHGDMPLCEMEEKTVDFSFILSLFFWEEINLRAS